jgi:small subunit ribosomal protein S9
MSTSDQNRYFYGVGRRKTSTARAKFYPTEAVLSIKINKKDAKEVLPEYYYQTLTNMVTNVGLEKGQIEIFVKGGGINGMVEAARLAIAKAILLQDESRKAVLRQYGYLTTDIRQVLPKRPGLRKARKREQWSKR